MTIQQFCLFSAFYLIVFGVAITLTRPSSRRLAGAIAGAFAAGAAGTSVVAIGERAGWWHFIINWEGYSWMSTGLGLAISLAFVFLLTWRIARRYAGRGLAIALLLAALVGPFRDSAFMAAFPEWGYYAPGITPMLAISAAYVIMGVVGHGLMRLIVGPSTNDPLTQWLWKHT